MDSTRYSTWVEVDLDAIRQNVAVVARHTGVAVMAVVKANAYGHGAIPVARAALRGGASWLAVARLEEGLELRQNGLDCPILMLGYTPPAVIEAAIRHDLSMTVWTMEQIETADRLGRDLGHRARLHLKVDTGMSRLGVPPEEALLLARRMAAARGASFEGVFTHFARADEADPAPTDEQERRFRELLQSLEAEGLRPRWVHAANSAASMYRPSAHFDMVRLGIAMYGLHPSSESPLLPGMRPALTWKAVLSHVKTLPPGRGVSYGHEYITSRHERIGTIPVGYADGFRRLHGNVVLVGGKRVPVVGRVCMDQIMVQLDEVPDARPGDEVVLIGQQGEAVITAEDVARVWGTINYEVTCAIGPRVPRLYGEGR